MREDTKREIERVYFDSVIAKAEELMSAIIRADKVRNCEMVEIPKHLRRSLNLFIKKVA